MNLTSCFRSAAFLIAGGAACLAFTASAHAQVQKHQSTSEGVPLKTFDIDRGEVVLVTGRDLVLKKDDGTLEHFAGIPANASVTVNGKEVAFHDLKPGMKLEHTITTTMVPKTITTVETVSGTVWHVIPPKSVILKMDDGKNHQVILPPDHKVMADGKERDAWHLKKGMKIEVKKVIEVPESHVSHERTLTASAPPPEQVQSEVTALQMHAPILFLFRPVAVVHNPAPAQLPKELPKTGSMLPLVGLCGLLMIGLSVGLWSVRSVVPPR